MKLLQFLSLRQMLTVPYVLLVLLLAATIGGLSYAAGRVAVDTLSKQLLSEMVYRIAQAAEMHVSGSSAVLETAFPTDVAAPENVADDLDNLRTRFWLATSVHREPNNYAYYGDRNGQFFGLWRHSASDAELRLRTSGEGPRTIHGFTGISGELRDPVRERAGLARSGAGDHQQGRVVAAGCCWVLVDAERGSGALRLIELRQRVGDVSAILVRHSHRW